jgi:hypothetical protein
MDTDKAQAFAREWVKAWNDHDIDAILAHYSEDIVFHSPRIRAVTGRDADFVTGKADLRAYWTIALERLRNLYFEIEQVLPGSNALTILYTNERSQQVAETFIFDPAGKVERSVAAYV